MKEQKLSPLETQWKKVATANKSEEGTKRKFKAHLLYLHHRFTEEGEPDHIITVNDLAIALNTTEEDVKNIMRRAYRVSSLNVILAGADLPHKPIKEY